MGVVDLAFELAELGPVVIDSDLAVQIPGLAGQYAGGASWYARISFCRRRRPRLAAIGTYGRIDLVNFNQPNARGRIGSGFAFHVSDWGFEYL